jgi:hypothetical protein
MIDEANRQITTTASINLNLDIVSSSQIVTEVDYSFSSVSSVVTSSIITLDKNIIAFVDINLDVSNIVESSNITLLTANTLSAVSLISTLYSENTTSEVKLDIQLIRDNTNVQTSCSIVSQLDVPLTVYTLSNVLTSKLAKNADVTRFYKTGSLDYFEEFVVLVNPISIRNGIVTLDSLINEVYTRDNEIILVSNKSVYKEEFYDSYNLGNAGFNLKTFENSAFVDTGLLATTNTIGDLSLAYPSLTIKDFEDRPYSSITLTGEIFNFAPPSTQNPVVYSTSSNLSLSSTLTVVGNISKFPTSGYIFQGSSSQYSVISYTGKTSNSFTGCVLIAGSSTINSGNDIIPYTI